MSIAVRAAEIAAITEPFDSPRFEAILGGAGTGKSTLIRERAADDPNYAKLVATTGIAAVNLGPGVATVNSVLGFFDEASAVDSFETGRMARRFCDLSKQGYRNLVIDEVSMMPAGTLTAITLAAIDGAQLVQQLNGKGGSAVNPISVILTGDFLQLPPIKAPFAFNSPLWKLYDRGITKLDKVYRQTDATFLAALLSARAGRGTTTVMKLNECGVKFVSERDDFYEGTSLVPTNDIANKINSIRYAAIEGDEWEFKSTRWGKDSSEWRDIPESLFMKNGAFVMILANEPRTFGYVNGDQGEIVEMLPNSITVEIHRGEKRHTKNIPFVWRETTQKEKPDYACEWDGANGFYVPAEIKEKVAPEFQPKAFARFFEVYDAYVADAVKKRLPYFSVDKGRWVIGWIEYMPIRLAYASTIHKSQGLTLDRVQIDARSKFGGMPGMQYVALSRCRTPENIRIVCNAGDYARRIQTAAECQRWV